MEMKTITLNDYQDVDSILNFDSSIPIENNRDLSILFETLINFTTRNYMNMFLDSSLNSNPLSIPTSPNTLDDEDKFLWIQKLFNNFMEFNIDQEFWEILSLYTFRYFDRLITFKQINIISLFLKNFFSENDQFSLFLFKYKYSLKESTDYMYSIINNLFEFINETKLEFNSLHIFTSLQKID